MSEPSTNNLDSIIDDLIRYNAWRRDDTNNPLERLEMPNPTGLGLLIDDAIIQLKHYKASQQATESQA